MAENKTLATKVSASGFITSIKDKQRQAECKQLLKLMQEASGEKPTMWGNSVVGFGKFHYRGRSGREGDWYITGFSPRATALTIYIEPSVESFPALMKALGKYRTGKGCIYLNKLEDINLPTLKKLVQASFKAMKKMGNPVVWG